MTKKTMSVLLALVMAASFAACGSDNTLSSTNDAVSASEAAISAVLEPTATPQSTATPKPTPEPTSAIIKDMAHVISIYNPAFVIKEDGSLWGWGNNGYTNTQGGVGLGYIGTTDLTLDSKEFEYNSGENEVTETIYFQTVPVKVMDDVISISAGRTHALALKSDGTLWTWGLDDSEQLGTGGIGNEEGIGVYSSGGTFSFACQTTPVQVMDHVVAAYASVLSSFAIKNDGSLWAWGYNWSGQLGVETESHKQEIPVKVMDDVVYFNGNGWLNSSYAVTSDGTLWRWGYAGHEDEDVYSMEASERIRLLAQHEKIMDDVKAVSSGDPNYAIKNDGSLWAWGNGHYGDSEEYRSEETPVFLMDGVKAVIASDYDYTLVLKEDGTLLGWGVNGQDKDASRVSAQLLDHVVDIANSGEVHFAIKDDGTLWSWGNNDNGQLGDGTTESRSTPAQVMEGVKSDAFCQGEFQKLSNKNSKQGIASLRIGHTLSVI